MSHSYELEICILTMSVLSKLFIDSMKFQSKSQKLFVNINKLILKFIQRDKEARITRNILKKGNNVGRIKHDLRTFAKAGADKHFL